MVGATGSASVSCVTGASSWRRHRPPKIGEVDAAREAEASLRRVLEASPGGLTVSRVGDGHVIYRSPAATEFLGAAESSFAYFARRAERAEGEKASAMFSSSRGAHEFTLGTPAAEA